MLRSLGIANFKAFGVEQTIPLRPITLVFGANSSGKSSIIQSLLLLKQTLEDSDGPNTALLPKGKLVDLGSYRDFVYRHETKSRVRLVLEVDPPEDSGSQDVARALAFYPQATGTLALTFAVSRRAEISVEEIALMLDASGAAALTLTPDMTASGSRKRRPRGGFSGDRRNSTLPLQVSHVSSHPEFYRERFDAVTKHLLPRALKRQVPRVAGLKRLPRDPRVPREEARLALLRGLTLDVFIREQVALHKALQVDRTQFLPVFSSFGGLAWTRREIAPATAVLTAESQSGGLALWGIATRETATAVKNLIERMVYLGPLRKVPERFYTYSGTIPSHVGTSGQGLPDLLFRRREVLALVNRALAECELDYRLEVNKAGAGKIADLFTLRLREVATGVTVSPLDAGFGISQMLPIVAQSVLSEGQLICIEQPELHLHPRLQAALGSLIVAAVQEPGSNQFLIETHSEHLILRLQRLVRRGILDPDHVAIVHVRKGNRGSVATEIRLGDDGRFLDPWPDGFFEEGFVERFSD